MAWHLSSFCPTGDAGGPSRLPRCIATSRRAACSAWLVCIVFAAVLLARPSLHAEGELEFAVPDDGRITLGVFNDAGKLVRILHKLAREEDFEIGLNGLITKWDGRNDAGERVAAGHYHVRGYLIGEDLRVSGEDFLFNDWAADPGFPGFDSIQDFSLLENGDVLLLAAGSLPGISLTRFSPEKGFLWSVHVGRGSPLAEQKAPGWFRQSDPAGHPLGGSVIALPSVPPALRFLPLLASNSGDAFAITDEGAGAYSLDDGKETSAAACGGAAPLALTANDSEVFVSSAGGLTAISLPGLSLESLTPPPSAFTSMDADASTLVGASPEGVWIRRESFQPVTLPASVKSVALGTPETFWFVGVEDDEAFVGQASFVGEILRMLRPSDEDPKPEKIRASRKSDKFAVIESLPGLQRLRVMARAESGEWTIEWERTLRESAAFGFVDGKPSAGAGDAPQEKEIRFRLKENPLTGKRDFLTLRAEFNKSGSILVSPDGLPLVEVSSRADIRRIAIRRGQKTDSLRLLQGNGSFVEEFSIAGLDDIFPLDAGSMDLP